MQLISKLPSGPIETSWDRRKFEMKLVNRANKRKYSIIVVGSGLAGGGCEVDQVEPGEGDIGGAHGIRLHRLGKLSDGHPQHVGMEDHDGADEALNVEDGLSAVELDGFTYQDQSVAEPDRRSAQAEIP